MPCFSSNKAGRGLVQVGSGRSIYHVPYYTLYYNNKKYNACSLACPCSIKLVYSNGILIFEKILESPHGPYMHVATPSFQGGKIHHPQTSCLCMHECQAECLTTSSERSQTTAHPGMEGLRIRGHGTLCHDTLRHMAEYLELDCWSHPTAAWSESVSVDAPHVNMQPAYETSLAASPAVLFYAHPTAPDASRCGTATKVLNQCIPEDYSISQCLSAHQHTKLEA